MAQSILMYGPTGSFKSSNCAEFIEWVYTRYGGITRGLFGDNYGPMKRQVQDGLLVPWDLTTTADPLACILLAGDGYWPEQLKDGVPVGSKLVKGNFTGVSAYVIEGFKENADLFMRLMERKRQATGEPLVGEHASTAFGQTVSYAVGSRGTYQFVQNQTHRYFKLGFKGLPVEWIAATSHDYAKKKDGVYGVAVAGSALAKVVPQWFDHCLHFEKIVVGVQVNLTGKVETILRDGSRAWFNGHLIDNVRWHAKLGVESHLMDYIYSRWPHGYIPLTMKGTEYASSVRALMEVIDPYPQTAQQQAQPGVAAA